LNAAIVARLSGLNRELEFLNSVARRARLNFGRFAGDRRRCLLAFECLVKCG
jgi:hypothetical protein